MKNMQKLNLFDRIFPKAWKILLKVNKQVYYKLNSCEFDESDRYLHKRDELRDS